MLAVAAHRVTEHGWDNVRLIAAPVATAPITDFTGFDQPWRLLAEHVPDLQVRELAFTSGYLAVGHTPGRPAAEEAL